MFSYGMQTDMSSHAEYGSWNQEGAKLFFIIAN